MVTSQTLKKEIFFTRGHARFVRIPLVIRLGDSRICLEDSNYGEVLSSGSLIRFYKKFTRQKKILLIFFIEFFLKVAIFKQNPLKNLIYIV